MVQQKDLKQEPCRYYYGTKCEYSDEKCRYSHALPADLAREYFANQEREWAERERKQKERHLKEGGGGLDGGDGGEEQEPWKWGEDVPLFSSLLFGGDRNNLQEEGKMMADRYPDSLHSIAEVGEVKNEEIGSIHFVFSAELPPPPALSLADDATAGLPAVSAPVEEGEQQRQGHKMTPDVVAVEDNANDEADPAARNGEGDAVGPVPMLTGIQYGITFQRPTIHSPKQKASDLLTGLI